MVGKLVRRSGGEGRKAGIRHSRQDTVFYTVVYAVIFFLLLVVSYPLILILSSSFSDRMAVLAGKVVLFPVGFSLEGYRKVFEEPDVLTGYANTAFYTVVGTAMNVAITMMAAYPFARKGWPLKRFVTFLFTFTMFFSGGMIPSYLLMSNLKLLNTRWAILLPGMLSVYNMVIARTFIQSNIPAELLEAAQLDGCDEFRYFAQIVLPLCKAVIAVITLFCAVGHWNAYFNAFIYLSNRSLYPLQIILREILIVNSIDASQLMDDQQFAQRQGVADLLKYSLIVVSTAPILCVYPFAQRYFMKGVMIGSVKG